MNAIQRWLERRRNRRESDKIAKRQFDEMEDERKVAILKEHIERVTESITRLEFKVMGSYASDDSRSQATMVAIGPDKRVYRLTVFSRGGYRLESLQNT